MTLKNEQGLNIHRGRMGCPPIKNLVPLTRQPVKSVERQIQEQPHSDRNIQAPDEREEGSNDAANREALDMEKGNASNGQRAAKLQDGHTSRVT